MIGYHDYTDAALSLPPDFDSKDECGICGEDDPKKLFFTEHASTGAICKECADGAGNEALEEVRKRAA